MANNSTLPATGDVIRDLDRSGVKTPISGLDLNIGGGSEILMSAGQQTSANSMPVALPTDSNIYITVTPTISSSPAYSAGDALGGVQTLANAAKTSGGTATLQTLSILDKGNKKAAIDLLFFNANPTAATITDNAAFVYSTDTSKYIGMLRIPAGAWVTYNSIATCCFTGIAFAFALNATTSLYVAAVSVGTPTYASTTDLIFGYTIYRD